MEPKESELVGMTEYEVVDSHDFARAVGPLREMMRTASHNNWRNIRL
jgi:hypothetical protein